MCFCSDWLHNRIRCEVLLVDYWRRHIHLLHDRLRVSHDRLRVVDLLGLLDWGLQHRLHLLNDWLHDSLNDWLRRLGLYDRLHDALHCLRLHILLHDRLHEGEGTGTQTT